MSSPSESSSASEHEASDDNETQVQVIQLYRNMVYYICENFVLECHSRRSQRNVIRGDNETKRGAGRQGVQRGCAR